MLFKTEPWAHQLAALKYFMRRARRGLTYGTLFTDMGSGKTKIMIDFINNMDFKLVVIVAPKKAAELVWRKEIDRHSYKKISVLETTKFSSAKKVTEVKKWLQDGNSDVKVMVINYDSIWREPFKSFILGLNIDCIICDELHRIKSPSSKCSRFLHRLGQRVQYRYGMTGTPMGQSPLDIYAQYRFINDEIFGTNMRNFENYYANMIDMGNYRMLDKKTPFKNLDDLRERMFSCAFTTDSEVELPPTTHVMVEYTLPPALEKAYKELQKEGCLFLQEGVVDTKNVLSLLTRLQQIVNGYVPVANMETDEIELIEFDNYRQEVLQDLLEGIPPNEKVVIFCKYTKDIKDIKKVCDSIERGWVEISGRANQLGLWDSIRPILIVQIQAGAEGLDFTAARYCVDYDLHYSLLLYKQSRKRIHRPGQTRPVVYYTIIAKLSKGQTVDERIYTSLMKNEDVIQSIMEEREI